MITRDIAGKLMVAILAAGMIAGCASTKEPEEPEPTGPSAAAKNEIYSAKLANAKAAKLGYEWRDTADLIAQAEQAAAAGDNDKAVALAREAREQAENAIDQYYREQERLKGIELQGHKFFGETGAGAMMDDYRVVRGDNLWSISGRQDIYGDPYQWPLIYKANAGKIEDADLIYPGQVFDIDRAASPAAIDAAVRHAKTRGAWALGAVEDSDRAYLAR